MQHTLLIRHESSSAGSGRFVVQRARDMKTGPTVEVADPLTQRLADTELLLGAELTWYLERYLDYPFGPNIERAERVTQALTAWGVHAFDILFGQDQSRDWYRDATRDGHTQLHLGAPAP